jgi:F-type H+-transporting ATPase subunit delta
MSTRKLDKGSIGQLAREIWMELQSNKKYNKLDELLNKIRKLRADQQAKKIAEIISAKPLSAEEKNEIIIKSEKKVDAKIMPVYKVDPSILGGIKVKVEDQILDLSWKGKLQLIRTRLEAGK